MTSTVSADGDLAKIIIQLEEIVKQRKELENEEKQDQILALQKQIELMSATFQELEEEKKRIVCLNKTELMYGRTANHIDPPSEFSEMPVLRIDSKKSEFYHCFPFAKGFKKFDPKYHNITDFLQDCNRAQKKLNLSQEEFIEEFMSATQGDIRKNINIWLTTGETLTDIYFKLINMYDKQMTFDQARKELDDFKLTKDMNFTKLVSEIARLASIANSHYPAGEIKYRINEDATRTLIKCLPQTSHHIANNEMAKLIRALGEVPTFTELVSRLRMFELKSRMILIDIQVTSQGTNCILLQKISPRTDIGGMP